MKKIVALALITITFNLTVMGQKKYKEIRITKTSETINVSADDLWQIVGPGFQNVGDWITTIDLSTGFGEPEFEGATCSERTCHVNFAGYDKVSEKLTMYNKANRELAYKVTDGMPGFVLYAYNHWTITEIGPNQCTAQMVSTLHLKRFQGFFLGRIMKRKFGKGLDKVFVELKAYAETKEVSEAKKLRIKELEKKKINT